MKATILALLLGVLIATNGAVSAHAGDFARYFFDKQMLDRQ